MPHDHLPFQVPPLPPTTTAMQYNSKCYAIKCHNCMSAVIFTCSVLRNCIIKHCPCFSIRQFIQPEAGKTMCDPQRSQFCPRVPVPGVFPCRDHTWNLPCGLSAAPKWRAFQSPWHSKRGQLIPCQSSPFSPGSLFQIRQLFFQNVLAVWEHIRILRQVVILQVVADVHFCNRRLLVRLAPECFQQNR